MDGSLYFNPQQPCKQMSEAAVAEIAEAKRIMELKSMIEDTEKEYQEERNAEG